MNRLDLEKLTVEFMEGVTEKAPIIPRRYTLTHSDIMGDLFVYFLNANPEQNKAEDWGIFADYGITAFRSHVMAYSIVE